MDIYFVNSLLQAIALVVMMLIVFFMRQQVGSRGMFIGFEMLLLTVLLMRIDEIFFYWGVDVLDRPAMVVLTWIVILIFVGAFIGALRRKRDIRHIEELLRKRERYQETLNHDRENLQTKQARVV